MAEVSALVEGGKATAGAPLGPALGPLGVNIGDVVSKINEKTKSYSGMKVPVTIEIHKDKSYEIIVGSPPTSALIVKELKAQKGGANQKTDAVGNLTMVQVKKLAEMKLEALTSTTLYSAAREIIGTCNSMAVTIEGLRAKEMQAEFEAGKWNSFFGREEKPALTADNFASEIKKEVSHLKAEAKVVIEKVEHKLEHLAEEAREKIHKATAPQISKPVEKKELPKMEAKPIQKPELKEKPKVSGTAGRTGLTADLSAVPKKETYMQHMAKLEKEVGLKKKDFIQDKPHAKVETETIKSNDSEIIRPKKKK